MQDIVFNTNDDPTQIFFNDIPILIEDGFSCEVGKINSWSDWKNIFKKKTTPFDRPVILIIDEVDKLPNEIMNNLISLFRGMYLNSKQYMLHGLALVGVRAVLGIESKSGSPFNIQRSLHISNLTFDKVQSMFDQYQKEGSIRISQRWIFINLKKYSAFKSI